MSFWSSTSASPSLWDTWAAKPHPRYIRVHAAEYPHAPDGFGRPRRLVDSDAGILSAFWKEHYGGSDWYLDCTVSFVLRYIQNPHMYIFGLFLPSQELIGTIVSSPFSPGYTQMSHGATLATVRVIEGLCIHRRFRSQGVAGFLIGFMDAYTSEISPVAHLWGRELSHASLLSTAFRTDTYAYMRCVRRDIPISMTPYSWTDFRNLWISSSQGWIRSETPRIVGTVPSSICDAHTVWSQEPTGHETVYPMVVVANTQRKTRSEHVPILEVVWCGYRQGSVLYPADGRIQYKPLLEEIASRYDGILFASSAPYNGGASPAWGPPWTYGTSGLHTWFLYNYMPPAFGRCELLTIRDEL
jgi:hypothetical protein